jgi:hypothetical protein
MCVVHRVCSFMKCLRKVLNFNAPNPLETMNGRYKSHAVKDHWWETGKVIGDFRALVNTIGHQNCVRHVGVSSTADRTLSVCNFLSTFRIKCHGGWRYYPCAGQRRRNASIACASGSPCRLQYLFSFLFCLEAKASIVILGARCWR